MNYTQGEIKEWRNSEGKQILWMITENVTHGIVIHSDGLIAIGTVTNLEPLKEELNPFVGEITIKSQIN